MKIFSRISKPEQHKTHVVSITVILAISALIVFELSPIGGNVGFYTNWVQCGQKPIAGNLSNDGIKYYYESLSFPGAHPAIDYFCTPLEAEIAGYSANPDRYEFPHINAQ